MERQAETTIAVLAALLVLFSAMIDPLVSMVVAVAGLLVLGLAMARGRRRSGAE